jgi:hypothetical protein
MCSCSACQRRSGSPFGEGAYFQRNVLTFSGVAHEYVRVADSGVPFHIFFCPTCATSLYFYSDRDPARVGVAVGAFADPGFPAPQRSVFDDLKAAWIALPDDLPGFTRGRDSPRSR